MRRQIGEQRTVPYWSAKCGARRRPPDVPARCRAAANGRPDRRRSRNTPRSFAPACAGNAVWSESEPGAPPRERAAHPPGDGRRRRPQQQDRRRRSRRAIAGGEWQGQYPRRRDGRRDRHRAIGSEQVGAVALRSSARSTSLDGFHSSKPAVREQHPSDRADDRVEADSRLHTAETQARAALARRAAAQRYSTAARCCRNGTSTGLFARSEKRAITDGASRMPTTTAVQSHAGASTVHPTAGAPSEAAGTRLRRRLSNTFHCDSIDSGLRSRLPSGPCTRRRSHPSELPVAADPAPPAGDIGAVARGKLFVQLGVTQQIRRARNTLPAGHGSVCGSAGKRPLSARSKASTS